jgi:hypothetical protein
MACGWSILLALRVLRAIASYRTSFAVPMTQRIQSKAGRGGTGPMPLIEQILCFCLSAAALPYPQTAIRSGDIWYTHEIVGQQRHLLRLSTTDLIVDWNDLRVHRLHAFAEDFAGRTCPGRYVLKDTERKPWPKIHTQYGMQFMFQCRSR